MIIQVDNLLSRGPRPEPVDFGYIRDTYAAVLSLEGIAEDKREEVELFPVPVISYPISFWQIYVTGNISLATVLDYIRIAPKPLLVHCQHGQDRTGLVIAAYRVKALGWSKQAAMAEAREFGYRWWLNFGLNRAWSKF